MLTSLCSLLYVTGECHRIFYTEDEPDKWSGNALTILPKIKVKTSF